MKIIAHRGASGQLPENTLEAFSAAMHFTDAIELDVFAVEGRPVVIHDETVDRTTNGTGHVTSMTFAEIRALRIRNSSSRVPTLQEVLDIAAQRNRWVNIELKDRAVVQPVARIIRAYLTHKGHHWSRTDFLVSSFDHEALADFKGACPDVGIGVLFAELPEDPITVAKALGAHSLHLQYSAVDVQLVQRAHAADLCVYVYTVNEQYLADKLKAIGVDGIFTDYPNQIRG